MQKQDSVQENARIVGVRIRSIKRLDKREDVYCLAGLRNGTMIANGIITRNCDALRYAIASHKMVSYDASAHAKMQQDFMTNKYQPTRGF